MDLYNRLSACGVIKRSFHLKKLPSMNLVDLDPDHTNKLKSGSLLAGYLLVFKSLLKSQHRIVLNIDEQKLRTVREASTHYTDIRSNWVVLITQLLSLNIQIDKEAKAQCMLGNTIHIRKVFENLEIQMASLTGGKTGPGSILDFTGYRSPLNDQEKKQLEDGRLQQTDPDSPFTKIFNNQPKHGVDIESLSKDKLPSSTSNTLEFILNTMCRGFDIEPMNAATFITYHNKNLTEACLKGIKKKFLPLQAWMKEVHFNCKYLCHLLRIEHIQAQKNNRVDENNQNVKKILMILACGCISPKTSLVAYSLKTLRMVAIDLSETPSLF